MKYFFDLLILIGIWITAAPAVILLYHRKKSVHHFEYRHPRTILGISTLLLIGTGILIYGSIVEPRLIAIKPYDIDVPHVLKPLRIAFVADFQIGTYNRQAWVQTVVKKIDLLKPDIVLLGGDNVDNIFYDEEEVHYLEPLRTLAKKYPVYAVHGNHEYGIGSGPSRENPQYRVADMSVPTKKGMEALGIHYLVNDLEKVTIHNQSFYLFGGDSYWAGKLNFDVLKTRTEKLPTIALVHNPSFIFDSYPHDVDLYLSGHTHGGQIRLPFVGPLGRVDEILPLDYYKGIHALDSTTNLLVTAGIGETGTRARLWNLPEIVVITLK